MGSGSLRTNDGDHFIGQHLVSGLHSLNLGVFVAVHHQNLVKPRSPFSRLHQEGNVIEEYWCVACGAFHFDARYFSLHYRVDYGFQCLAKCGVMEYPLSDQRTVHSPVRCYELHAPCLFECRDR